MRYKYSRRLIRQTIGWSLFAITALYVVSGFGITAFRIVTPATFGLLDKPTSFRVHDWLLIPFLILLCLHLVFRYLARKGTQRVVVR
jgi:hypothetical protein